MKYLLDTNLISELIRPQPDQGVVERCRRYEKDLATAAPVWHELQFGCYRMPLSRKRELLELFLEDVIRRNLLILPYDAQAARWQALERARLTLAGNTPSFVRNSGDTIPISSTLLLADVCQKEWGQIAGLPIKGWGEGQQKEKAD